MATHQRILCVDDEPNILAGMQRTLRKRFAVTIAEGGERALAELAQASYAVVVADMHMPGLDGAALLEQVRQRHPETIRIMLTGAGDLATATAAVNRGHIFRFLSKPCPPEELERTLDDALRQHQLITAERVLLESTLNGSVRVLSEVLSLAEPELFGRREALRQELHALCRALEIADVWAVEMAMMLAPIGRISIPPEILAKHRVGQALDAEEADILSRIPEIGSMLLANIPRLEPVARMVLYQSKAFDGTGFPPDSAKGEQIPMGARVLLLLGDLADLHASGLPLRDAMARLQTTPSRYDPRVLAAAVALFVEHADAAKVAGRRSIAVALADLRPGMVLRADVLARDGSLLVGAGMRVGVALVERLLNYARAGGVREPLTVDAA